MDNFTLPWFSFGLLALCSMGCQFVVMIIIGQTLRGDCEVKNTVSDFANSCFVFISEQLAQKFCLDEVYLDDTLVIRELTVRRVLEQIQMIQGN
jgi:hypothetical protein